MTRQDMIEIGYLPKPIYTNNMKLEFYNPKTLVEPKKAHDCRLIIRKNGAITFTKPAEKHFELKPGDQVQLCRNLENGDFYFFKHKEGFKLKQMGGQQLGFSCTSLVNKLHLWKDGEKSLRILISTDAMHYDGINYFFLSPVKK